MTFSALDYLLLVILLALTIFGGIRGILHLSIFVLSMIATYLLFTPAKAIVMNQAFYTNNETLGNIIVFLVVFVVVSLLLRIVAGVIKRFLEETLLIGWIDNVLGGAFLFAIGAFLIYFVAQLVLIITGGDASFSEYYANSRVLLFLDAIFANIGLNLSPALPNIVEETAFIPRARFLL